MRPGASTFSTKMTAALSCACASNTPRDGEGENVMNALMMFLPESPMIWILVIAVIFLLFGGAKLPQLAKALGQSKKAFKEGLDESEQDEKNKADSAKKLSSVEDEALFEEAR